ncbi:S8 family serine peptidase [Acrocarpospora macrocephala]|uniref:Peptidase S8 n=1 Tax=Acrocarpospora macrocephala TaxID=150177 RepID=A0A5M3XB11_9ACTN|nr:S8/S53 family peptidase [Acrocarpospora macrocephala]GES15268.1 peptidase S8 [Acrocarpospora macrocephala]
MWTIDYQGEPDSEPEAPDAGAALVFPREILDAHGARVLNPATAPLGSGSVVPDSTVYHADMVLVPTQVLADRSVREWFTAALGELGLEPHLPEDTGNDPGAEPLQWRAVVLRVTRGVAEVDAWAVVQHLRTRLPVDSPVRGLDEISRRILEFGGRIGLNHLLVGSAVIGGEPVTDGHGLPGDTPGRAGFGYATRCPVQVVWPKPVPDPAFTGRAPVVALIDSGSAKHDWFDWRDEPWQGHQFLVSSKAQQKIVNGTPVNAARPQQVPAIDGHEDRPVSGRPLLGLVNAQAGHATFEAGLIHQLAPEARILNLRAMFADGLVSEHALHLALEYVLELVEANQRDPDTGLFVDVVSLSCGYFNENRDDRVYTQSVERLVDEIRSKGVMVVAAAGNYAATKAFYPSGLAGIPDQEKRPFERAPIFGVGAKNPNGSIAIFSNGGAAIKYYAPGAMLISTFPPGIRGSAEPELELRGTRNGRPWIRESYDPDDFRSGFALWSGTSFAAPIVAGQVLAHLIRDHGAQLADVSADAALTRGTAIVKKLQQ